MYRKYAVLDFVQSLEEVPVKYKLLRKCGQGMMWWYIKKYNPFIMENMTVADEEGYKVKLPLTARDALTEPEIRDQIVRNTLEALKDFRVSLLLPPHDYPGSFPDSIRIATGRYLYPFFARQAVERALQYTGCALKNAEILITGTDDDLTIGLVNCIYPHVNYLSVMVNKPGMASAYEKLAADIFADVGLNLQVTTKNKSILENADCIINTGTAEQYDYYYKRGAVYLDFCGRDEGFKELLGKRNDMLALNGLRVCQCGRMMNLEIFELAFFLKSASYRNILYKSAGSNDNTVYGFNTETIQQVMSDLAEHDVRFGGFCRLGQVFKKEGI